MGRASRNKRNRPALGQPRTQSAPLRRHGLAIAGMVVALLMVGLAVWIHYRAGEAPPRAGVSLPDPDTSSMTVPVARAIGKAWEVALAQPDSAEAVGRLGQVCHAHWLHDAAAACYEIARELAPEDFRWIYLGAVEK